MRRFMMAVKRAAALAVMLFVVVAWTGRTALAQIVFEDNFNGNALLPHWITPPASHWDYDVSGGMLNVHRLHNPSNPKSHSNSTGLITFYFSALSDFDATARITLDPPNSRTFGMSVGSNATTLAIMQYTASQSGGGFTLITGVSPTIQVAGPGSTTGEMTIRRVGLNYSFLFNEQVLATLPGVAGTPMNISIGFEEPYPNPGSGGIHVDFVRVVPSPGGVGLLLLFAIHTRRR